MSAEDDVYLPVRTYTSQCEVCNRIDELVAHYHPPRRKMTLEIDRVRNMVPSKKPYLVCMYNGQEAVYHYDEYRNEKENDDDLGEIQQQQSRHSSKVNDTYASSAPIWMPTRRPIGLSNLSTSPRHQSQFGEAIRRMRQENVRDAIWKECFHMYVSAPSFVPAF
jgi:hypothetical protein